MLLHTKLHMPPLRPNVVSRPRHMSLGYVSMFAEHVQQDDKGGDFDFLVGSSGDFVWWSNH